MTPIPTDSQTALKLAAEITERFRNAPDEEFKPVEAELFSLCVTLFELFTINGTIQPEEIQGLVGLAYMLGKEQGRKEVAK